MAAKFGFFSSTIGKKVVMAVTGAGLFLFIIGHLLGNLQVFLGQKVFNDYAEFLKATKGVLWGARIGLLVIFVLHVATAYSLWRLNSSARPEPYRKRGTVKASTESLYMMQSGTVILIFLVIHLLHFTIGALQPEHFQLTENGRHDVFSMLVLGFQNVPYSAGYIVAMLCLGMHLSHAISSLCKTLGLSSPRHVASIERGGYVLGYLIAAGYISIPVAVLTGIVTLPAGGM